MSPGATNGRLAGVADVAAGAQSGLPSAVSSSKLCAIAGAIASDAGARSQASPPFRRRARRWRRSAAPARCGRSGFRSPGRRPATGPRLRPCSAALACRMPFSPSQVSAIPIGSSTAVRMRRSLAAGRQPREPLGSALIARPRRCSAELADEVEEIVGNRLHAACRRRPTQRAAEIAGRFFELSCRKLATSSSAWNVRLPPSRFPSWHSTPRPPSRGSTARSYKSHFAGATARIRAAPLRYVTSRPPRSVETASQRAGPATETKWPVLGSTGELTSLGAMRQTQQTVLPGLKQSRRRRQRRRKSTFRGRFDTYVPWPGTRSAPAIPSPLRARADRQPGARRRLRPRNARSDRRQARRIPARRRSAARALQDLPRDLVDRQRRGRRGAVARARSAPKASPMRGCRGSRRCRARRCC